MERGKKGGPEKQVYTKEGSEGPGGKEGGNSMNWEGRR